MHRSGKPSRIRPIAAVLLFLAGLLLLPHRVEAQLPPGAAAAAAAQTEAAPDPLSPAQLDALIETLDDPADRAAFLERLRTLRAAQAEPPANPEQQVGIGASLLASLSARISRAGTGLAAIGAQAAALPDHIRAFTATASDPAARARWAEIVGKILASLVAAFIARWLVRRLLARTRSRLEQRGGPGFWHRMPLALAYLVMELVPIAAFAAVGYGVLSALAPVQTTRLVALALLNAQILVDIVMCAGGVILMPKAPGLRLVSLSDESANYTQIWLWRLTAVGVYGYALVAAGLLLGLTAAAAGLLLRLLGLLMTAMLVVLVLQNRVAVGLWLRGRAGTSHWARVRARLAEIWHILAIAYLLAIYIIWALSVAGGFEFLLRATVLTALVLVIARLAATGVDRLVRRSFAVGADLRERHPGLEARANRYLPLLDRAMQAVIWLLAFIALLQLWGVPAFAWLESDVGRRLTGSAIGIAVILVTALIASEIVNSMIERYLRRKDREGKTMAHSARIRTLLPLLRNAFRVVLAVMVILIVMSELGIDIAPLLAGAGVVGLAIGFGAQTLVRDVITGFFMLIEDVVAIGDVIEVDGHSGTVEAMTIRTLRLRDGNGAVHTIPFSAVTTVKNLTKDFAYAVLNIKVGYGANIDRVLAILQEVGDAVQQDQALRASVRGKAEVIGVNELADYAVVVQARIRTSPGGQWAVEREFRRRVMDAFEAAGIPIPSPTTLPPRLAPAT